MTSPLDSVMGQAWPAGTGTAVVSVLTTLSSELPEQGVSRPESEQGQLRASHLPLRILVGLLCVLAHELFSTLVEVRFPGLFVLLVPTYALAMESSP